MTAADYCRAPTKVGRMPRSLMRCSAHTYIDSHFEEAIVFFTVTEFPPFRRFRF